MTQPMVAKELGVCLRTVRNWDTGANRVPWSAVRLLRLIRGGDLGELSDYWRGWRISGKGLWTPEGRKFEPWEGAWWSLTIQRARSWDKAYRSGRVLPVGANWRLLAGSCTLCACHCHSSAPVAAPASLPASD